MRRKSDFLIAVFMVICAVQGVSAENYPYRSDVLWLTVPDHPDWLYRTGEEPVIEITFCKYGIPRDALVEYSVSDDLMEADTRGSVRLKGGRAFLKPGTSRRPGFRDIVLTTNVDSVSYTHHIKIGFSVDKIQPVVSEPEDFLSFWSSAIAEARRFPLTYSVEQSDEFSTEEFECRLVKLMLSPRQSLYGYLFIPRGARDGSCPAVLCPPGAGVKTIKEPLRHRYYAENGWIRLETEIHGLDPRMDKKYFDDASAAFGDYLSFGLDSPDRYYMKRVYVGLVRALDFLCSLPEWDGTNLAVQGGSQGGALSLVAAGLDPRVTLCVANHPALADMAGDAGRRRAGGYPHFDRKAGILSPEAVRTLSYYDVVNFARHITCPVRMTWGYNDNTCQPTTSYAVWNTLSCPKESLVTPVNEHWTSEQTERGHCSWLTSHLKQGGQQK